MHLDLSDDATLITCFQLFCQWTRSQHGGREYRGLRTHRYTYARDLNGPWLLYDNEMDPYQMNNLVNVPEAADVQRELDQWLQAKLDDSGDQFLPGADYLAQWGYEVDETGTVPYTN